MKMLKLIGGISAVVLTASMAQAGFVSTYNITASNFSMSGFADGSGNAVDGPLTYNLTNLVGTFSQNLPPAGGLYDILININYSLDFDKDGIYDEVSNSGPVLFGPVPSPGNGETAFNVTDLVLPDFVFDDGGSGILLTGLLLDRTINFSDFSSGVFDGTDSSIMTLHGGNIFALNSFLTIMDNLTGGGDGIVDGWSISDGSFDYTAVPLPSSLFLGLGLFGGMGIVTLIRRRA